MVEIDPLRIYKTEKQYDLTILENHVVPAEEIRTEVGVADAPITATQELIGSGAELILYGLGFLIICLYIKFRNHKWIAKLNLDPASVASGILSLIDKNKDKAREAAIKAAKDKNMKIDVLDKNVDAKDIRNLKDKATDKMQDKINDKSQQ